MSLHSQGAFLVSKKGTDEKRSVIDFKNLNKVIKVPQYAMPNVEDLLALIGTQKTTIYSKIDIREAFRQLRLTEKPVVFAVSVPILEYSHTLGRLWD